MKPTKKEQIEIAAKELFWKHGFKKVSINEICKKANVSRKTFYTLYQNKNALVLYIFKELIDEAYAVYEGIAESEVTFSEKMEKILVYKYQATKSISLEFINDFYNIEAGELLNLFNSTISKSMLFIRDFFQKAQDKGELNPSLNLEYVIWLMQKSSEMCGTQEVISMFPNIDSMIHQVTQTLIYGIMPVNK